MQSTKFLESARRRLAIAINRLAGIDDPLWR
jgi:hypothetical protein